MAEGPTGRRRPGGRDRRQNGRLGRRGMRMITTLSTTSATPADSPGSAGSAGLPPTWGGRPSLAESRAYCEYLTKTQARNFYYGLKLLPEPKRSAMFALYAWMRLVDDIADEDDGRSYPQRVEDLEAWRQQTRGALEGRS